MYDDDEIGLDPNPITIDDDDYVGRESETFGDAGVDWAGGGAAGFFDFTTPQLDSIEMEKELFKQGRIETPAQSSTGSTGGDSVFLIDEDAELEALEATTAASPPKPAAASAPTATPSTPQQQQQARSSFGIWDSPSKSASPRAFESEIWGAPSAGTPASSIWTSPLSSSPAGKGSLFSLAPTTPTKSTSDAKPAADVTPIGRSPAKPQQPATTPAAVAVAPAAPASSNHTTSGVPAAAAPGSSLMHLLSPAALSGSQQFHNAAPMPRDAPPSQALSLSELEQRLATQPQPPPLNGGAAPAAPAGVAGFPHHMPPPQRMPAGALPPHFTQHAGPPAQGWGVMPPPPQHQPPGVGVGIIATPLPLPPQQLPPPSHSVKMMPVPAAGLLPVNHGPAAQQPMPNLLDPFVQHTLQTRRRQIARERWQQNKQRMQAHEIESIIRLQEQQLQTAVTSYADDYYYQTLYGNKFWSNIVNGRFPLADLPEKLPPPELYHLPICESQSNEVSRPYTRKSGTPDPLAGALGRIPAHSVKAPRELIQLQNDADNKDENKKPEQPSLVRACLPLIYIEDAYTCLLDLEDINSILRVTPARVLGESNYDNMLKKRLVIIEVLAAVIGLSLPGKPGSDEVLLQILQRPKGKRLITRALKALPAYCQEVILFFVLRNLEMITNPYGQATTQQKELFDALFPMIDALPMQKLAFALANVCEAKSSDSLPIILESEEGVLVLHHILHSASCAAVAIKRSPVTPETNAAMHAWLMSFSGFLTMAVPLFPALTRISPGVDHTHADCVWRMVGAVVANCDPNQTESLLETLRESITLALRYDPEGAVRSLLVSS